MTGGWGNASLGFSSMNMQVMSTGKLSGIWPPDLSLGKRHILCAEPAGHLSGGELRRKQAAQHRGDNS